MLRFANYMMPLLIAVLAAGCQSYRNPSVTVAGISVSQQTAEGAVVDVSLELSNPNNVPLRLIDIDYSVSVEGQRSFSGTRSAEATLAANEVRQLKVPAFIPAPVPGNANVSATGSVEYLRPGELARIFRDIGLPNPRASFQGASAVQQRVAQAD